MIKTASHIHVPSDKNIMFLLVTVTLVLTQASIYKKLYRNSVTNLADHAFRLVVIPQR